MAKTIYQPALVEEADIVVRIKPNTYLYRWAYKLAETWNCTPQEAARMCLSSTYISLQERGLIK